MVEYPDRAEPGPDAARPLPLINSAFGLSIFGQQAVYDRILRLFVEQYRPAVEQFALQAEERELLENLVHKLRGSAANLGLERVSAAARTAEARLKQGGDAGAELGELSRVLRDTLQLLEETLPLVRGEEPADALGRLSPPELAACFPRALAGLERLDPDAVELELARLCECAPEAWILPVRDALDRFDFAAAETALRALAARFGIRLSS